MFATNHDFERRIHNKKKKKRRNRKVIDMLLAVIETKSKVGINQN